MRTQHENLRRSRLEEAKQMAVDEDGNGNGRWLVSYADFMTLLMAFFVVMYSLSQVSEDHFRVLSESFDKAFNPSKKEDTVLNEGEPQRSFSPSPIDLDGNALEDNPGHAERALPDNFAELQEQKDILHEKLESEEPISTEFDEKWTQIELSSEVLFEPGGANIDGGAETLLAQIAAQLSGNQHLIRVEGFTDTSPIQSTVFGSNWELSSARAVAVVKELASLGIDPGRLSAVGYGEYQPIATNTTDEGRAKNRRIVINVSRSTASLTRWQKEARDLATQERRLFDYELRPELPDGVAVYGLQRSAQEQASDWLANRLGGLQTARPTTLESDSSGLTLPAADQAASSLDQSSDSTAVTEP